MLIIKRFQILIYHLKKRTIINVEIKFHVNIIWRRCKIFPQRILMDFIQFCESGCMQNMTRRVYIEPPGEWYVNREQSLWHIDSLSGMHGVSRWMLSVYREKFDAFH